MPLPSLNRSTSDMLCPPVHSRKGPVPDNLPTAEVNVGCLRTSVSTLLKGTPRPACATSSYPATAEIHCTKTSMVARRVVGRINRIKSEARKSKVESLDKGARGKVVGDDNIAE